jgi:hypothetical protein
MQPVKGQQQLALSRTSVIGLIIGALIVAFLYAYGFSTA